MKTKILYNLKDFNDWFADYLVLNEMHSVLEPDKDPVYIEDTIGCMNERIGNAPTFNDAINMIVDYAYKNYNIK